MLNRLGGMTKKQLVALRIRSANIIGFQNSTARTPSLSINSPRWPACAHRRTRDSNASVGLITSPGDAGLMEARSQRNESDKHEETTDSRCNLGPRFDS